MSASEPADGTPATTSPSSGWRSLVVRVRARIWWRESDRTSKADENPLRSLLYSELRSLSDTAIKSKGAVAPATIESLTGLARLAELNDTARERTSRRVLPLAIAIGITLAIISVLIFRHVSETMVEMQLSASEVAFVARDDSALVEGIGLSELQVVGLKEVQIRGQQIEAQAIRLATTPGDAQSSITLSSFAPGAGNAVRIARNPVPNQYRFEVDRSGSIVPDEPLETIITVVVSGKVDEAILPSGEDVLGEVTAVPEQITLVAITRGLQVILTPTAERSTLSTHSISIKDLSLFSVPDRTGRRTPTVIDGSIVLEELDRKTIPIRPGEYVTHSSMTGRMWGHAVDKDHLALRVSGKVSELAVGSEDSRTGRMPRLFEWIGASYPVSLLWGLAGYVFIMSRFLLGGWRKL
jgi:hypothetical protein